MSILDKIEYSMLRFVYKLLFTVIAALLMNSVNASQVHCKYVPPMDNEVGIAFSGINMPIGRILLVRYQSDLCAVVFTRYWEEIEGRSRLYSRYVNKFAEYITYCNSGKVDHINGPDVVIVRGKASELRPKGPFRPLLWQPGDTFVKCGQLKLTWGKKGLVCFYEIDEKPKDYGVELAPTPWRDISEVNLSDSRIQWYRYDANRKNVNIPIDNLWKNVDSEK